MDQELQLLNELFKELFYDNFLWIIILLIITSSLLVLHLLIHLFSNKDIKTENSIRNLKKKIEQLEYKLFTIENSQKIENENITLRDIAQQLNELKHSLNDKNN